MVRRPMVIRNHGYPKKSGPKVEILMFPLFFLHFVVKIGREPRPDLARSFGIILNPLALNPTLPV